MPSPVGHALAGRIVSELCGRCGSIGSTVFWACAPDLDMLPGLLDREKQPDAAHAKATHSLGSALVAAGVSGVLGHLQGRRFGRCCMEAFAAYASHLLLDVLGKEAAEGLPLLWPLSRRRFGLPHVWFPTIISNTQEHGFWRGLLARQNAKALGREVVVLLPLLLAARRIEKRRAGETASGREAPILPRPRAHVTGPPRSAGSSTSR